MKAKVTLTQNLTYMALMAAINVVFSLIAMFFPLSAFFLMIALPLTSVVVTLFCQNRYFVIYAVATVLLSLIVTMQNMEMTIFYVIPSLASGFLFGMMIKAKINPAYILLSAAMLQVAISYITIPIIEAIYGPNMIDVFLALLKLDQSPYMAHVVLPTIFTFSLAQTVFSYMIIQTEVQKFQYDVVAHFDQQFPLWSILAFLSSALIAPWLLGIALLLWAVGIYFSLFQLIESWFKQKKLTIVLLIIGAIFTMILYPIIYPSAYKSYAFYALGTVFYLVSVSGIFGLYLPKATNSHTIEK